MTTDTPDTAELERLIGAALANDIPDAVIFADGGGAIRFWNAGATRIFGFSREDALGQSLDIIIPERQRERHWAGFQRMIETGQSRYRDDQMLAVPALTQDGRTISIEFTLAPVRDGEGRIAGLVALLRDVTKTFLELKRLRSGADR